MSINLLMLAPACMAVLTFYIKSKMLVGPSPNLICTNLDLVLIGILVINSNPSPLVLETQLDRIMMIVMNMEPLISGHIAETNP